MVAPVVVDSTVIKGLVIRATREDACGVPLCGVTGSVVTKGWVEVNLSPNLDTGTDFSQKLADGDFCVNQKDRDFAKWYDVEIKMCGVQPALLELAGGKSTVLSQDGKVIGFNEDGVSEVNFGLEIWDDLAAGECDPSGAQAWFYQLIPGMQNMVMEDINHGNKYVDFSMKGNSFFNPNWGKGPYDVMPELASGHAPGPLLTCIGPSTHFRAFQTTVGPPTPADGYVTVPCAGEGTDGDPAVSLPCS